MPGGWAAGLQKSFIKTIKSQSAFSFVFFVLFVVIKK
jgi:hypothetical protein